MNTTIGFEPETLTVDENLFTEILRAADTVGELYGVENSELSVTLTDDEHIHALNKKFRGVDRATDVVRHEVVSRIVEAYERFEATT